MAEDLAPPAGALMVRYGTRAPVVLRPGGEELTFGRGSDCTLRLAHDSASGGPDLEVSRHAGTIHWRDGLWWVRNDSSTRPFDLVIQGVRIPLRPRSSAEHPAIWAVSPPGLAIRIDGPHGPYTLTLAVGAAPAQRLPDVVATADPDGRDASTGKLPRVSDRDRLILAAKFLSLPEPGDAIGDREAADYANAALAGDGGEPVTERSVMRCVKRWRTRLQDRGVPDIDDRLNINNLGRKLLAYGVLRQEYRDLLRPR